MQVSKDEDRGLKAHDMILFGRHVKWIIINIKTKTRGHVCVCATTRTFQWLCHCHSVNPILLYAKVPRYLSNSSRMPILFVIMLVASTKSPLSMIDAVVM